MQYDVFLNAVLKATSEIANKQFGKVQATFKPDKSALTETDLEIGKYLVEHIRKVHPKHNIIDEEAGIIDNKNEYTWILDPIDGTFNFSLGLPQYGIMVGLLKKNIPIAGGVALPFFNEIIVAEKGKGAYLNGNRIHVTEETDMSRTLLAYECGYISHKSSEEMHNEGRIMGNLMSGIKDFRSSNSVYDAVLVAKGKYGALLSSGGRIWDIVAQDIILQEAGAISTDFFGKPIDYSNPLTKTEKNYDYCIAAPHLHKQLQELIHK